MPENSWLFDEQGRMRADLPPLLHPPDRPPAYLEGFPGWEGLPAPANAPSAAPRNRNDSLADKAMDTLGIDVKPDFLGDWRIKPKVWKNPTPGADWRGIYAEANLEDVPIINWMFGYK